MLAFGTPVDPAGPDRPARRPGGRAASGLWPLITRLEARVAAGYAEQEAMSLPAQARMSPGVALGHLLPGERLATAAFWTGRALRIAWHLQDRPLLALVLRMHGNELRKAGHPDAGIIRLRQALQAGDHPVRQGAGLVLLARAAAGSGQAGLFDVTASQCVQAAEKSTRARCAVQPVHRPGGPPARAAGDCPYRSGRRPGRTLPGRQRAAIPALAGHRADHYC